MVDMPWRGCGARTASCHCEPSVALVLRTARQGNCTAGDVSIDTIQRAQHFGVDVLRMRVAYTHLQVYGARQHTAQDQ